MKKNILDERVKIAERIIGDVPIWVSRNSHFSGGGVQRTDLNCEAETLIPPSPKRAMKVK